ncbi:MAG: metallophosphoesterase [Anaerolineae bacterium]
MSVPSQYPTVWAIGDTHLSFGHPRDQTRFGEIWADHANRIRRAWEQNVQPDDIVLLAGDLSWAHTPNRVLPDIEWLASLPGRKVLVRGNHDFWWKKLNQVRTQVLPRDMYAVQGSSITLDGVVICGTMGHIAPNDPYFQSHKLKSYHRELRWLAQALQQAETQRVNGNPVILMMHYPPFTSAGEPSGFTELIQQYRPDICVYGHLHLQHEWQVAANGPRNGTRYHLVAADYLAMQPLRVWLPQES